MKLKNRYMKKMLLNLLVIMLSLFCITACGKIKKDPEVVKYITDKINQDINKAIPKDKLEIDSYKESISKTLKKYFKASLYIFLISSGGSIPSSSFISFCIFLYSLMILSYLPFCL